MGKGKKKKTSAPPADAGASSSSAAPGASSSSAAPPSRPSQPAAQSTSQPGADVAAKPKRGNKGRGRGSELEPSVGQVTQAKSDSAVSTQPPQTSAPGRGAWAPKSQSSLQASEMGGQGQITQSHEPISATRPALAMQAAQPVIGKKSSAPQADAGASSSLRAPPGLPQSTTQPGGGGVAAKQTQNIGRSGRGGVGQVTQEMSDLAVSTQPSVRRPPQIVLPTRDIGVGSAGSRNLCLNIPQRKDINKAGTSGQHIVVETNHLALNLSKLRTKYAIHYDVALVPDLPKRLLRFAMEELRKKHYPNRFPAFDGRKNLISATKLPFGDELKDSVKVRDEESQREKEFEISIQYASMVDLTSLHQYTYAGTSLETPQTAIQMIDIVLRSASSLRFVPVGRSFFTPPTGRIVDLGDGLEMWLGLFQSVNLGWKPFVNVDVVHKGFPKQQPVLNAIRDILLVDSVGKTMDRYQKENFEAYIKGLKVDYMLPGQPNTKRTYRVNKLHKPASELSFDMDGKSITVEQYFRTEKRSPLRYPHLPCLHVGSLQRPNPIYLPAEFCTITGGQAINRKMNEKQTSSLIKQAATNTRDRKRKIQDALRTVNFNEHPAVKEFGLSVSEQFEKVQARILDPPTLTFKEGLSVTPRKGVWQFTTFLTGRTLTKWTVLNLDYRSREDHIRELADLLMKNGRILGMTIENPSPLFTNLKAPLTHIDMNKLIDYFNYYKNMELIFVVVPDKGNAYAKVKQVAELSVGVLTQCIKARTLQMRMNQATASNLLLKVNSKLNGINHMLSHKVRPKCLSTPAMLVGADVTHPSPEQINIPSVAAVCASHDPNGFCYNIQVRLQPARQEIITDLEAIMRIHLIYFFKKTGQKPNRILFYRDGVSEGQFSQVLSEELNAIRNACSKIQKDGSYKPAITFLVVQKRHHTRFFPTRPQDEDGRNANVPAGTIVDTTITHPTELDFYLVSHASIQGVSRPTKYRRLWDDSNMTEDELEQLTYFLCHLFSRCTRSVSYPAPTYYAHLAAYRARVHIEGRNVQMDNLIHEQELSTICEVIEKNSPMFFV